MRSDEVLNELKTVLTPVAPVGLWKVPSQKPPMFVLDVVNGGTVKGTLAAPDKTVTVQVTATGRTAEQAAWLMDKGMKAILEARLRTGWAATFTSWDIPLDPQIEGFYSFVGQIKVRGEV